MADDEATTGLPAAKRVAAALNDRADELADAERREEALVVYGDVLARIPQDVKDPRLRMERARALLSLGITYGELGRVTDAIAAYDATAAEFGGDEDPGVLARVAWALHNKAHALANDGRAERALATYDEVRDRFGGAEGLGLVEHVRRALIDKGLLLNELGRQEEAIAELETAAALRGAEPTATHESVRALVALAFAQSESGRDRAAISTSDRALAAIGNNETMESRRLIATALYNKMNSLTRLGQVSEALLVQQSLFSRFAHDLDEDLRGSVVDSLIVRGAILEAEDTLDEAYAAWRDAAALATPTSVGRERSARARAFMARAMAQHGDLAEAVRTHSEVIDDLSDNAVGKEIRLHLARSLYDRGVVLERLTRLDDALASYREVVARFADDEEPEIAQILAYSRSRCEFLEEEA